MVKVGLIGDDIASAKELIRILLRHPDVHLAFADIDGAEERKFTDIMQDLCGECDCKFTSNSPLDSADVLFCCNSAGKTKAFLHNCTLPTGLKVIDLSPDFRLASNENPFTYGLPELNKHVIAGSDKVSVPSTEATSLCLASMPLAKNLLLNNPVQAKMYANKKPSLCVSASEASDASTSHTNQAHITEAEQILANLQRSYHKQTIRLNAPIRPSGRCLTTTITTNIKIGTDEVRNLYRRFYEQEPFTHVVDNITDPTCVSNTNKCLIRIERQGDLLHISCCLDPLVKGRAGTATHIMNLLFGLEETTGLILKSSSL